MLNGFENLQNSLEAGKIKMIIYIHIIGWIF